MPLPALLAAAAAPAFAALATGAASAAGKELGGYAAKRATGAIDQLANTITGVGTGLGNSIATGGLLGAAIRSFGQQPGEGRARMMYLASGQANPGGGYGASPSAPPPTYFPGAMY